MRVDNNENDGERTYGVYPNGQVGNGDVEIQTFAYLRVNVVAGLGVSSVGQESSGFLVPIENFQEQLGRLFFCFFNSDLDGLAESVSERVVLFSVNAPG